MTKQALLEADTPATTSAARLLSDWLVRGAQAINKDLAERLEALIAGDKPASELAHTLGCLRDAMEAWAETGKVLGEAIAELTLRRIPEAFEREGVTTFTTSDGYRVTVSTRYIAAIKADMKDAAKEWLRAHQLGDLIIETVNASTLSAAGKALLMEGRELPDDLFNTHYQPNASLTRVKVKAK